MNLKKRVFEILDKNAFDIMMIPGAILVFIFSYLPMGGIILAFKNYKPALGIWESAWVGFDNFRAFFSNPDFWVLTRNTLGYNIIFLVLGMTLSLCFAILISELRSVKSIKFYQTVAIMPHFLSYVIVSYIVFAFLGNTYGVINQTILPKLGLEPVSFYAESKWWPYIIVFVREWKAIGYSSVIYFAAISGISPEYYEAAAIDGANRFQRVIRITIPLLRNIICIQFIMALGKIFNADLGLFLNVPMNQGALFSTTGVMSTYVYKNIGRVGYGSAAGLYSSVMGFVLILISNYIIKRIDSDAALF